MIKNNQRVDKKQLVKDNPLMQSCPMLLLKHIYIVLVLFMLLASTVSHASDIGLFASIFSAKGKTTYRMDDDSTGEKQAYDSEFSRLLFGAVVNADLDENKMLTYSLSCGLHIFNNLNTQRENNNVTMRFKGIGVSLSNSLELNLLRFRYFRLWAGPTVGLGYSYSSRMHIQDEVTSSSVRVGYSEWFILAAASAGISIFFFDTIALNFSGGYQFMFDYQLYKYKDIDQSYTLSGFPHGIYISSAVTLVID